MTDDDIPLDIAGHGDRDRDGDAETGGAGLPGTLGDGADASASSDADATASRDVAAASSEDDDEEVEPVELLVGLAEDGEIDPWDIDVVTVTDKYLDRLDEADLRTSGRALFYASVLLRMKGDGLLSEQSDEPPEPEPWEQPFVDDGGDGGDAPAGPDPVAGLEAEMERRLDRKSVRGKPETLDELVRELRDAERDSRWKESREYDTSGSPQGFRRGTQTLDYHSGDDFRADDEPTEDEVTGNAHEEDIETVIEDVNRVLREQYDAGRREVLYAEIDDAGGSRVETYLALLFLANRDHVRLEQDELFGDLWIQDPSAVEAEEPAIAD
ncbi:condensin subunit ScpA [Natronoarchaeum philippinense]|uniref:Condensin subunit ScpA n=1 Tax=Natronoarchaeum philippinense TaxID=558529 RepID=A0A285NWC8_NATPI|nr:ScpA family protein [Natronoarchaeum philippinense]SNZ13347.1 condensin subunit ScpA [Natronoarchaeum philippinense]